jgi:hypothetical protein
VGWITQISSGERATGVLERIAPVMIERGSF